MIENWLNATRSSEADRTTEWERELMVSCTVKQKGSSWRDA